MAPIHKAAHRGDLDTLLRELRAGADVNTLDSGGQAPLVWATYSGSLDVLRLLLSRGARTDCRYKKGASARVPRASSPSLSARALRAVHVFPERPPLSVRHSGRSLGRQACVRPVAPPLGRSPGWTPLHIAAREDFVEVARLLIKYGADAYALTEARCI